MRRAIVGLMLIPGVLSAAWVGSRGSRDAVASPVEATASARLARMMQGRFEAPASGTGEGRVGAVARRVCRVSAPTLGTHVLYAEEQFASTAGHPLSQRVFVIEGTTASRARVREFTLLDPGGARGLCDDPTKAALTVNDVTERAGCVVEATWRDDHFEGTTRGSTCRSVLNGASHAKRDLVVRDGETSVHDRGFDPQGVAVWGHLSAPMRFARRAL